MGGQYSVVSNYINAMEAEHTSLSQRISEAPESNEVLTAIDKPDTELPLSFTLSEYIQLVRWTVHSQQSIRPVNLAGLPSAELWIHHYPPKPNCWQRA